MFIVKIGIRAKYSIIYSCKFVLKCRFPTYSEVNIPVTSQEHHGVNLPETGLFFSQLFQAPNKFEHQIFDLQFLCYDDVIKWKHFPRYWPLVRGIHRSPVNSPHKGQWRGALMFSLICARINGWANNGDAGDLRCHRAHYDIIVMKRGMRKAFLCHGAIVNSMRMNYICIFTILHAVMQGILSSRWNIMRNLSVYWTAVKTGSSCW